MGKTKTDINRLYGMSTCGIHGYLGEKYTPCPVCAIPNWQNLTYKQIDMIRLIPLKEFFKGDKEGFDRFCATQDGFLKNAKYDEVKTANEIIIGI